MEFPSSKSHNSEPLVLSHQRLAHNLPGYAAGVIRGHKSKSVSGKSLPVVPHDIIIGHWCLHECHLKDNASMIYDLWSMTSMTYMYEWNKKWRYVLNGKEHDRHIIQWHNIGELNIIWYMICIYLLRSIQDAANLTKKGHNKNTRNPPPVTLHTPISPLSAGTKKNIRAASRRHRALGRWRKDMLVGCTDLMHTCTAQGRVSWGGWQHFHYTLANSTQHG